MRLFKGKDEFFLRIKNKDVDSLRRLYILCNMLWFPSIMIKPEIVFDFRDEEDEY